MVESHGIQAKAIEQPWQLEATPKWRYYWSDKVALRQICFEMEFTDLSVSLEWQELNTYIEDKSNLVRDTELRHINTILDPQDSLLPTNGVITYIKN